MNILIEIKPIGDYTLNRKTCKVGELPNNDDVESQLHCHLQPTSKAIGNDLINCCVISI